MTALREAAQAVLDACTDAVAGWESLAPLAVRSAALESLAALRAALEQQAWVCPESPEHRYAKPGHCEDCGRTLVLAQQPGQQPRSAAPLLTPRELELLHGLIERELWRARTCDAILARPDGNHRMASAQKGWDMERVALLRKLGGIVA